MAIDNGKIKISVKTINDHFNSDVVKFYSDKRNPNSLPSITGKIEGNLTGIELIMRAIFGQQTKVESLSGDVARNVSGTYDSYVVQISSGNEFYFRSIIGERGVLTSKDLTPSKLGLGGVTITKRTLDAIIDSGLANNSDLPLGILELCRKLIDLVKKKSINITPPSKVIKLLGVISKSDLKKLGNNFGEVILSVWCLYNKPYAESIFFPKEENAPLADFIVNFTKLSKKPSLNVSAKFKGGANASLNSIMPLNSKPPVSATVVEEMAFKAIMAVAYNNIIDGLLNAEKILKTPEYLAIKKMVKTDTVTLLAISGVVEAALKDAKIDAKTKWVPSSAETKEKYNVFLKKLEPFYDSIEGSSGNPSIQSIPKIVGLGAGKYYHPICYSFSVALAKRFNSNIAFSSVLDKAANAIKAEQIYLDITNTSVKINVKQFATSKFEFAAGAYTYKADNVRMKVKLINT